METKPLTKKEYSSVKTIFGDQLREAGKAVRAALEENRRLENERLYAIELARRDRLAEEKRKESEQIKAARPSKKIRAELRKALRKKQALEQKKQLDYQEKVNRFIKQTTSRNRIPEQLFENIGKAVYFESGKTGTLKGIIVGVAMSRYTPHYRIRSFNKNYMCSISKTILI